MTENIVDSLVEIPNKISCHASQVSATLSFNKLAFLNIWMMKIIGDKYSETNDQIYIINIMIVTKIRWCYAKTSSGNGQESGSALCRLTT